MTAADLARTIAPHQLDADPTIIERTAVERAPAYAARLAEIAREHGDRLAGVRERLMAALRETDPLAARTLSPSWRVWLSLLGAYIGAAAGFALYFSRAQLDIVDITPAAMGLAALTAVLYLLAAAPIRRSTPPPANVAIGGWIVAVLTGASVAYAAYAVLRFAPEAVAWLFLGAGAVLLIVVVAVAAALVRGSIPLEQRTATQTRVAEFSGRLREAAEQQTRDAQQAVRDAFAAQSPPVRAAIETDLAEASAVLRERGLAYEPPALPGWATVGRELDVVAMGIGVRDLGAAVTR